MNLDYLRKIAGINLKESDDEDDDLSPAERELAAKADTDLKKKGVNVDADVKAAEAREAAAKTKKPAAAPAPKEEPKAEKKEDAAPAPSEASKKAHRALAWLKAHKTASRGEFIKAAAEWGMSPNYASAHFRPLVRRIGDSGIKEAFIFIHPSVTGFVLAENRALNRYQWVKASDEKAFEPLAVYSQAEAEYVVKYMSDHQSQHVVVERLDLDV